MDDVQVHVTISTKRCVVRMRFVVCAFINRISCVYVEPVKRTTYVAFWHNGKFFLAPTVVLL